MNSVYFFIQIVFSSPPCTFLLWCQQQAAPWPHQPIHDQFSCSFLSKMPSYVKAIAMFAFYRTLLLACVHGRTDTSLEGGYPHYSLLLRKHSCRVVPAIRGLLVGLLKQLTLGRIPLCSPPIFLNACIILAAFLASFGLRAFVTSGCSLACGRSQGCPRLCRCPQPPRIKCGQVIHPRKQGVGNIRALSLC